MGRSWMMSINGIWWDTKIEQQWPANITKRTVWRCWILQSLRGWDNHVPQRPCVSPFRTSNSIVAFISQYIPQPWPILDTLQKITLLRVIPTMAFNSSHLTFCLANLLAFYLAYLLTFYLAYLLVVYLSYLPTFYLAYLCGIPSGISSDILSGISFDILSGILSGNLLTFCLSYLLTFYLAYLLKVYLDSIWQIFWHSIWHSIWHSLWHSIWLCFWPLRSG